VEKPKRRFCTLESPEGPAGDSALNTPQNILASALERHGIPYELLVNQLERYDTSANVNSCDLYPNGAEPRRVFVYDFLTTDPHFERACTIVSTTLPNYNSDSVPR
jgi:hypothetical protein